MTTPELMRIDHSADLEKQLRPSLSFGMYLPKKILTNQEIESWKALTPSGNILTADNIEKRTGIVRRYVANEKETAFFMGFNAAQHALNGEKADAVIVSTSFPVGFNLSQRISEELGLSPDFNLDVHAACSGFTFSLAYIKKHEKEFLGKKILLVAAEKYSPHLHDIQKEGVEADPSLAQTLFSDGAYAMTFEYDGDLQILSTLNHRFPKEVEQYIQMPIDEALMVPPFAEEPVPYPASGKFEQDGRRVLNTVFRNIWSLIDEATQKAGLDPSEIKKIFPHQGSGHMTNAIIKGKPDEYPHGIVYEDYHEGNFSSGSIPKALIKAINEGKIKRGDNLVLAGFGAGMFASIAVVRV